MFLYSFETAFAGICTCFEIDNGLSINWIVKYQVYPINGLSELLSGLEITLQP